MSASDWFDDQGNFIQDIPSACVEVCSGAGQQVHNVRYWRERLGFEVPRELAIDYLAHTGGWERDALNTTTDDELAEYVLWVACCDLRETGEWFGLVE